MKWYVAQFIYDNWKAEQKIINADDLAIWGFDVGHTETASADVYIEEFDTREEAERFMMEQEQ